MKRIYIARFSAILSEETFIKVGVSSNDIDIRFSNDLKNYKINLIDETKYYRGVRHSWRGGLDSKPSVRLSS